MLCKFYFLMVFLFLKSDSKFVSDPGVRLIHLAGLEFVLDVRAVVWAQMTKTVEPVLYRVCLKWINCLHSPPPTPCYLLLGLSLPQQGGESTKQNFRNL